MDHKLDRPVMFDYDRMIAFLDRQLEKCTSNLALVGFAAALEMVKECAPSWIVDEKAKLDLAVLEQEEREAKK